MYFKSSIRCFHLKRLSNRETTEAIHQTGQQRVDADHALDQMIDRLVKNLSQSIICPSKCKMKITKITR